MKKVLLILFCCCLLLSCERVHQLKLFSVENPELSMEIPYGFPAWSPALEHNKPTRYGVALGERLFNEKRLSHNNTISCSSCHQRTAAFADHEKQAIGIYGRVGLRNTPPLQNLAFMLHYNWDGNKRALEKQPLVPIITHEEMNSSIVEVMNKLAKDGSYRELFFNAFGDTAITPERIYRSLAQYQYTLISANSKYDRIQRQEGSVSFTAAEARGYRIFEQKCTPCHSTGLFTDQSFRNIGFPQHSSTEEAGRARVTGRAEDYMRFRVPSLRNIEYTAPYGSFGQFPTLRALLDYLDAGVLESENLDPILKKQGNRIPLSHQEKEDILAFLKTLSDPEFVGRSQKL